MLNLKTSKNYVNGTEAPIDCVAGAMSTANDREIVAVTDIKNEYNQYEQPYSGKFTYY